jgi:hypothetical protein
LGVLHFIRHLHDGIEDRLFHTTRGNGGHS